MELASFIAWSYWLHYFTFSWLHLCSPRCFSMMCASPCADVLPPACFPCLFYFTVFLHALLCFSMWCCCASLLHCAPCFCVPILLCLLVVRVFCSVSVILCFVVLCAPCVLLYTAASMVFPVLLCVMLCFSLYCQNTEAQQNTENHGESQQNTKKHIETRRST